MCTHYNSQPTEINISVLQACQLTYILTCYKWSADSHKIYPCSKHACCREWHGLQNPHRSWVWERWGMSAGMDFPTPEKQNVPKMCQNSQVLSELWSKLVNWECFITHSNLSIVLPGTSSRWYGAWVMLLSGWGNVENKRVWLWIIR